MKLLKISLKKLHKNIAQLIGLTLLIAVGTLFFIATNAISTGYENSAEQYFDDYNYADATFYGNFNNETVNGLNNNPSIINSMGRNTYNYRDDETIYRVTSLTKGINDPYIYKGSLPTTNEEVLMLNRNAKAIGVSVGDNIEVNGRNLTISGLVASSEYIYLVQNERTPIANPSNFIVLFVPQTFFSDGYNEIVSLTAPGTNVSTIGDTIGAKRVITSDDQINTIMYKNDLSQIYSFAVIFPSIFALLIAVVILVMLTRTVARERKQIGVMKAIGLNDFGVISIYVTQFIIAAVIGAIIGLVLSAIVTDKIISMLGAMFEVPGLSYNFYLDSILIAFITSIVICFLASFFAIEKTSRLLPAIAMRPRAPHSGKKILLERLNWWSKLSFNTRYSIKGIFRNKARFSAVILGMTASCALIVFSLGFYDSISNTSNSYINEYVDYDVIVNIVPTSLSEDIKELISLDENSKALVTRVSVKDSDVLLTAVESDFNMVNIDSTKLDDGVILPQYYANKWDLEIGDKFKIDEFEVVVADISTQYMGLTIYSSYDYLQSVNRNLPMIYNSIYGRDSNVDDITNVLKENEFTYSTKDGDSQSLELMMQSTAIFILFLVICSISLGFIVLYSISLVNLSAKEFEYMFMGVMGFNLVGVLKSHVKEALIQILIAIPLGFILGNLLLLGIKDEFSNDSIVIDIGIYPRTYIIAATSIIIVVAIMAVVTIRSVDKLDIVEGLKVQDE